MAAAAARHLSPEAAVYFETTARFPPTHDNESAWAQWRFVPRVARDVAAVSTAAEVLGTMMSSPLLLPPRLARAGAAGFRAVVVTVDAPVASIRLRGYVPDRGYVDPMLRARPHASPLNPSVAWSTIERIAGLTSLPVLVKGVLRADDARAAIDHGARGVIVSNHGSRQLDGVVPTAGVAGAIPWAVAPAAVLVDGGIRSGRDVLRALCLGAHAVLVGGPYLWALP